MSYAFLNNISQTFIYYEVAQKEGGKKGAKFIDPRGKGWSDSFRINKIDVMLLWEEDLENDGNMVRMVDAFLKYDRYEMPYIL